MVLPDPKDDIVCDACDMIHYPLTPCPYALDPDYEPPREPFPWWGAYVWLAVVALSFACWAVLFKLVWWMIQ